MKTFVFSCLLLMSFGTLLKAQSTVSTNPVGFVTVAVPAQSDAVLAVPLHRSSVFKGTIQSMAGSTLTVVGNPDWTANQFVQALPGQTDTFGVLIATGVKEGLIARVTSNTSNQLTIEMPAGDDLTGIKTGAVDGAGQGDEVDVMPYWTPSTLFPASPSTGSRLLFFPNDLPGINLSSNLTVLRASSGWFVGATPADHRVLPYGVSFVFRNQTSLAQTISMVGAVPMASQRAVLAKLSQVGQGQDLRVGISSPVPEFIGNLELGFTPGDRLLVFNNSLVGFNKSPSMTLLWSGSAWFQGATNVSATFLLEPGNGYVLRRSSNAPAGAVVWQLVQSYLQ